MDEYVSLLREKLTPKRLSGVGEAHTLLGASGWLTGPITNVFGDPTTLMEDVLESDRYLFRHPLPSTQRGFTQLKDIFGFFRRYSMVKLLTAHAPSVPQRALAVWGVEAASNRKVYVTNCRGANAVSVAEHVFALVLALSRKVVRLDSTLAPNLC
jgi:hypothetical protein